MTSKRGRLQTTPLESCRSAPPKTPWTAPAGSTSAIHPTTERPRDRGASIRQAIENLIKAHVEASKTRDLDALMAGFADDAVWITGRTTVRGRAGLTELFATAMDGLPPTLTIQSPIAAEGRAAAQLVEVFTHEGAENTDNIAGFYAIKDGRITSAKIYRAPTRPRQTQRRVAARSPRSKLTVPDHCDPTA